MTQAHCVKGDLGLANGSFSRIKNRSLRREVRRFCDGKRLTLDE